MSLTIDLTTLPEFQELFQLCHSLKNEVAELREQLPQWVDQVEAERLTGLSDTTLWRERKNPTSLIIWKTDRGIRYDRASLIAHMKSRAVVRHR